MEETSGKDGRIQSNYGFLILHEKRKYKKIKITSYENVLTLLKNEPNSRQAILHYNLPKHYNTDSKDIPCIVATQVLLRNEKLNFIVFQRSSDLYFGLPYDVPWHCYLLKKLVKDLNKSGMKVSFGSLSILLGSVHIYTKNKEFMESFLKKRTEKC